MRVTRKVRDILARYESDPALRKAAIIALNPSDEKIFDYFHLARRGCCYDIACAPP